jgi:hypothetical protein
MHYIPRLLLEIFTVSMALAVMLTITNIIYPIQNTSRAFLVGAVLGALFHLGCELLGVNVWYIRNGAARQLIV